MDVLTDECNLKLVTIVSKIDTLVDELINGTIKVGDLLLFHKHSNEFVEIARLVKETEHNLQTALYVRKREYDGLRSRAKLIVSMTTLCKKLTKGKTFRLLNMFRYLGI